MWNSLDSFAVARLVLMYARVDTEQIGIAGVVRLKNAYRELSK